MAGYNPKFTGELQGAAVGSGTREPVISNDFFLKLLALDCLPGRPELPGLPGYPAADSGLYGAMFCIQRWPKLQVDPCSSFLDGKAQFNK